MLSLRRRLVMVSILAAVACGASLTSIAWLARTSSDQRVARAEERVARETDRLLDLPAPPVRARGMRRGLRTLRSGYLDASGQERSPDAFLPPSARRATPPWLSPREPATAPSAPSS